MNCFGGFFFGFYGIDYGFVIFNNIVSSKDLWVVGLVILCFDGVMLWF